MLGNLLDTSPVPGRANETTGRKNTGARTDQSQQRFAHFLAEERRRSPEHSREAAQSAAEPAPPLRHRTGQMDAPHGKALPVQRQSNESATPRGAKERSLRADAPESRTNPKPERNSDAEQETAPASVHARDNTAPEGVMFTMEEGAEGRRLADLKTTLGPQAEPDELLAESGVPVNSAETGELNVLATMSEGDAKWLAGTGADGLDPQGAYWTGEALAAESGANIQFIASDNGFSAEWLEGLSDNELADLWQSLKEGQQPTSDEELAALLAETQTRPDVLNLAQFSPDWVTIQESDGKNVGMLNASDKAGTPGSAKEGKLSSLTAGVETDIEVDAEAANKEQTLPERPRGSLADLMATRIDAEIGRGLSVDDSGTMRQNTDALLPKQVVADLVKQHIERQIPVKNSASELTQRLSERMVMMIGQDIQEARIRLNPPEMGNLDIRVTTQNDQVQVQVVAQQPVVRDLLEHHAHRLREMLEQQGFGQVNVDVSEHSDRRGHDDGRDDDAAGAVMTADDESEWRDGGTVEQSVGLVDHYV